MKFYSFTTKTKFFIDEFVTNYPVRKKILCRISESQKEIWVDMYAPGVNQNYVDLPYIEFDIIETHLRYPDKKDDHLIGQQVGGNFNELVFQNPEEPNYINQGDMDFWFTKPKGGWRQGISRYYFLEEIPLKNANWPKLPKIIDGMHRKPLEDFKEGDLITGTCESIHLHHGICIDFGCTFMGLLPLDEFSWERIYRELPYERYEELRPDFDRLRPGASPITFKCKIRRKLESLYFRWPIELDVIDPEWLKTYITPSKMYEPLLLVVAEKLSKIDGREYARVANRPYRSPRRYAYRNCGYAENQPWLRAKIDYIPEDHSNPTTHHKLSLPNIIIQKQRVKNSQEKSDQINKIK